MKFELGLLDYLCIYCVLFITFIVYLLVQCTDRNGADSNSMEFEAKSARDGAWLEFQDICILVIFRMS